jgi:hypothetical protein
MIYFCYIVWNPDISQFEQPPFGLRRLEINTAAHNFHDVERFLTYILDTLGPGHLKQGLEVALIGESAQVHPNLRNGFTNLCYRVIETDNLNPSNHSTMENSLDNV